MNLHDRFVHLCEVGNTAFNMAEHLRMLGEHQEALEEARLARQSKAQAVLIIRNCPKIAQLYDWKED